MIQCKIYINASNKRIFLFRKKQIRNPSSYNNNLITILSKQMHKFNDDRPCSFHRFQCIIMLCYHSGLIILSNKTSAASSPLPGNPCRSRYNCTGDNTLMPSIFLVP